MIARLRHATGPAEARFFLFVGAFGLVLAAIYWVVSSELAGTILLGGFGVGAGLLGVRLRIERPADGPPGASDDAVPYRDESGRLPSETLAPLALALGVALALTAIVFGVWLLVAGIVPFAWGAWTWLRGAQDELAATAAAERRSRP